MRVRVTGGAGFLGKRLARWLAQRGSHVSVLALEGGDVGHRYTLGGEDSDLVTFLTLAARAAGSERRPRSVPPCLSTEVTSGLDMPARHAHRRPVVSRDRASIASHSFLIDNAPARRELGLRSHPLTKGFA